MAYRILRARPVTDRLPGSLEGALPSTSSGWRIYNVNPPMPRFDPDRWRLRIDGLVEQPITLSYDDLRGGFTLEEVVAARDAARGFSGLLERLRSQEASRFVVFFRNRPQAVLLQLTSTSGSCARPSHFLYPRAPEIRQRLSRGRTLHAPKIRRLLPFCCPGQRLLVPPE